MNLAQDLVQERLADWLDSSLESSMDTIEQDFEQKSGRGNREEDPEWDIPNGIFNIKHRHITHDYRTISIFSTLHLIYFPHIYK